MNAILRAADPPLTDSDLLAWIDYTMSKHGGQIEFATGVLWFDEAYEEPIEWTDRGIRIENIPSWVVETVINGKKKREAFPTLRAALRKVAE